MKKLIISEKPSVAQAIAKVLGATTRKNGYIENDDYIISWCIGHLVELDEPISYGEEYKSWSALPILPSYWNYRIKENAKSQFNILRKLLNDDNISEVICATDAGREGELIFRHTYNQARCVKNVKRLWISSLEDSAIKKGFAELKDSSVYDNLYKSALCREQADWLVGINATRYYTNNTNMLLTIGRVQTPTLAMIVDRDREINSFVKEKFYTVDINCGEFKAATASIDNSEKAKAIAAGCKTAVVTGVSKVQKKIAPPKLYDLTSLQRDANRLFGYTAQQTLDSVQRLYDSKLSTYPRTDSRYLTEDMGETTIKIIGIIKNKFDFASGIDYADNVSVVMNNKKVSDHHAIIPTADIENADFEKLTVTDRKILSLISSRLLMAVSPDYVYNSTKVTLSCNNTEFTAKGKAVVSLGFKAVENLFRKAMDLKIEKENEKKLPQLSEEDTFNVLPKTSEHFTTPPAPYTEDTLLFDMEKAGNNDYDTDLVERKGLGTPATRAAIIEALVNRGYVDRKNKQLIPTDNGKELIRIVPDMLKSAKLTAEWENKLILVSNGDYSAAEFMDNIIELVHKIVSLPVASEFQRETIGKCPRCGSNIYEGKTNFYCSNSSCKFVLWKNNKFFSSKKQTLTKEIAKALLKDGRIHLKKLYSPAKKLYFEADIVLDDTGEEYVNFKLDFSGN